MKRLIAVLFIAAFALISGCLKRTSDTKFADEHNMKATVAGKPFSSTYWEISQSGSFFQIMATNTATNEKITIDIENYSGKAGTWPISISGSSQAYAEYTGKLSKNGSVTLTSDSPNYIGTFYFTCDDLTEITNGTFIFTNK